jgi:geranylgeranyl diphosphate synthase type II
MVSAASVFEAHTAAAREQIEAALSSYCDFGPGCPPRLEEAIRYSLLAPGKRVRPLLVALACEACGGPLDRCLPAACAVEMIHAYSLIHDDLPAMDDDDLRRGRPTTHKVFGEAMAILAGDALQARALEIVARDIRPAAVAARCCALLAEAAGACHLVGGQVADMAEEFQQGDLQTLRAIHDRKTGAMLRVSLALGGQCAGASDEQLAALTTFGAAIGLAFQIADDLLDVRGDADAVGKRVGKDSDKGKLTFPGLLGIDESQRQAQELMEQACAALAVFGARAEPLDALARYIVERDR